MLRSPINPRLFNREKSGEPKVRKTSGRPGSSTLDYFAEHPVATPLAEHEAGGLTLNVSDFSRFDGLIACIRAAFRRLSCGQAHITRRGTKCGSRQAARPDRRPRTIAVARVPNSEPVTMVNATHQTS